MTVRLIALTPDAEKTMGYVARVSSPHQDNPDVAGLLKYCIKHHHWSVFEHAFATVEIETSRAIARQMLRHRSFSFSEFSQRYAEVGGAMVEVEARAQDSKNRQASHDTLDDIVKDDFARAQRNMWNMAMIEYRLALNLGIAKECARALLPEGLTPTRLYMSGSIRSWIHYCDLRSGNGTQLEHAEIAAAIQQLFITELPVVSAALGWTLALEGEG